MQTILKFILALFCFCFSVARAAETLAPLTITVNQELNYGLVLQTSEEPGRLTLEPDDIATDTEGNDVSAEEAGDIISEDDADTRGMSVLSITIQGSPGHQVRVFLPNTNVAQGDERFQVEGFTSNENNFTCTLNAEGTCEMSIGATLIFNEAPHPGNYEGEGVIQAEYVD